MEDELQLNFSIPKPSVPHKAPVPAGKDGGAQPKGNKEKPVQKAQPRKQETGSNSAKPTAQHPKSKPNDRRQQPTDGQGKKPQKQHGGPPKPRLERRAERTQQTPGKERFKRSAGGKASDPDDPDELLRAAPDDDEDDDVAAAMSMMAQREAALVAEGAAGGATRAPAAELEGVVEFDDDDDGASRKRRRLNSAGGAGGAGPIKATGRGNFTPGSLIHASANANANAEGGGDGGGEGGGGGEDGWTGLGLAASLSQQLGSLGFVAPTPIQRAVLPVLLEGRDALVRAQTGSGKTLCYLLPIIHDLQAHQPRISRGEGTHALVLAPTRELCIQVFDVATALLRRYHWLVPGLLIGGENRAHEKARLRKGVTLLAASPGRLIDHLQSTAAFRTSELQWLVLDEADRLLDLGFEAKLRQITELLNQRSGAGAGGATAGGPEDEDEEEEDEEEEEEGQRRGKGAKGRKAAGGGQGVKAAGGTGKKGGGGEGGGGSGGRQTVLLSATLHKQLGALAELALRDPAVVGFEVKQTAGGAKLLNTASQPGGGAAALDDALSAYSLPSTLRQTWLEVPAKERLMALAALLRNRTARRRVGGTKVVVFLSSCDGVEFHHHLLGDMWKAAAGAPLLPPSSALYKLHGDMPQAQRTETFAGFSKDGDGVLLCTDVAARGLDFPNVTTIIQYDVPAALSEYVHRVGRSARMGAAGEAVLMLMPHEVPYVNLLRSRGVLLEPESLDKVARWLPTPPPDAAIGGGGAGGAKKQRAAKGDGGSAAARQLAQQLHRQVATAVSRDPHAAKLAHDAFRSYVRAYATHSAELKAAFAVRNLHLGHVAHSFCLLETPRNLGSSGSAADRKRRKREAAEAADATRRKKMRVAARRVAA